MNTTEAATKLSSLANEARLSIFRLLIQAGAAGMAAGTIGEQLNIPASTLSFHLKELSHAGLINAKQESRFIYYSANYVTMNGLITFLTENCCAGDSTCTDTTVC